MRRQHPWRGADISCRRRYFMDANISWPPTFHGRRHFTGTDILMQANILCIVGGRQHFNILWFLQSVLPVPFCNEFCWFCTANICVYFSIYLCMLCAPIFLAQMFWKPRFKIDVVIMIICSIVIIINSVLTLQVSTAKYRWLRTLRNKGCVHPHLTRFIPEFRLVA